MTDIIIIKNKYTKSPESIDEVFESIQNPKSKYHYQLDTIQIISDTKILDVNPITMEITREN